VVQPPALGAAALAMRRSERIPHLRDAGRAESGAVKGAGAATAVNAVAAIATAITAAAIAGMGIIMELRATIALTIAGGVK